MPSALPMTLEGIKASSTTPLLGLELANISKLTQGGPQGLSYMWTGALSSLSPNALIYPTSVSLCPPSSPPAPVGNRWLTTALGCIILYSIQQMHRLA